MLTLLLEDGFIWVGLISVVILAADKTRQLRQWIFIGSAGGVWLAQTSFELLQVDHGARRFATVSRMLTYLLPHLRNGALAQKAGDFSARAGARPAANL
ncbi:protein of unknown function [Methylocella tundrae]|uniref:Uncharacterized protein n=1 Tax=Methylocella tundrae TaxID=227605 RepID=A0A4U8YX20_METTU|nr:hypothetical protein [Methylocella tundrae]VFU07975.1 protein of unknown function [Methylocella tundrae]